MRSSSESIRRQFDTLLIVGFALALVAPWIDEIVRSPESRGPAPEHRVAEPRPALPSGIWSLNAYPSRFERYFNDRLGLRDWMLRQRSIVLLFGLGISPTPAMVLGKDRWLMYTGDQSIPVYRGIKPLSDEEIDGWLATWERRRDYLAERGIEYLFVIAPNKETIYPEHMPPRFNKVGPTRWEQLVARLADRPDLPVLDLRDALLEAKRSDAGDDITYAPLGTHWNGRGHYAAYRAVAAVLQKSNPRVEPCAIEKLRRDSFPGNGDTWADRMYIDDLMPQSNIQYHLPVRPGSKAVVRTGQGDGQVRVHAHDDEDLPRGLLFHDSFGENVGELLSAGFRAFASVQVSDFDVDFIERTRPDVVIELFVERILVTWSADRPIPKITEPCDALFARSPQTLFRLAIDSSLVERQSTPTESSTYDSDGPRVLLRPVRGESRFDLPAIACPADREAIVRIEIDSPGSGVLKVHFRTPSTREYDEEHVRWALLDRGRAELYVRLTADEMSEPLRLKIVGPKEPCALRSLEARAVEPLPSRPSDRVETPHER